MLPKKAREEAARERERRKPTEKGIANKGRGQVAEEVRETAKRARGDEREG